MATSYASAVPKGVTHWTDLQNWKAPKSVIYEWSAKNICQMKVVKLKYLMMFTYGGGLEGKGKFLTGVTVQPIQLDVAWGYTVNVKFEAPDSTIVNVGSKLDPIAAMTATMLFSVDNLLVHDEYREVFYMQGDGHFKKQS